MDVRQLEMFRAVAEEAEQELGTLVLHRTGRGVTLTPDGEALLRTAHRINSEIQEALSQIVETRTLQRGLLSIGGGMTVALYILPKMLKKFRAQYGNVDFRITTGDTDLLLRLLRTRQIDLALMTLPILAADLEVRPVLKEEMVVVTAANHPLTRARAVDASQLANYPLVLFESGSNTRKVLDDFFVAEGMPVNVVMQTENVEIIKAMVTNGLGITILPYSAIAGEHRTGRFGWARIRARRLYRETGWVYLRSEYLPRAVTEAVRIFDEMKGQFVTRITNKWGAV